jgi:hypothetical protein
MLDHLAPNFKMVLTILNFGSQWSGVGASFSGGPRSAYLAGLTLLNGNV